MTSTPAPPQATASLDHTDDDALRAALRLALDAGPDSAEETARLEAAQHRWMQDWAAQTGQLPTVPDAVAPRPGASRPPGRPTSAAHHRPAHHRPAHGGFSVAGVGAWLGSTRPRHMPLWLGGAGLAVAVCAGVLFWQHQQNEALLDELTQVDVLSQMAAGDL